VASVDVASAGEASAFAFDDDDDFERPSSSGRLRSAVPLVRARLRFVSAVIPVTSMMLRSWRWP
jgi:hypothetical protein